MEGDLVNVAQAAEIYGCRDSQIYRLARRGILGPIQEERLDRRRVRFWFQRAAVESARPIPPGIQEGDWYSLADGAAYLGLTYDAVKKRAALGHLKSVSWAVVPEDQRVYRERPQRTYIEKRELDRFAASLYHDRIGILPSHHTLEELVYAACFIDSEGHILLQVAHVKGATYYHPRVGATNTCESVIQWMHETFGGWVGTSRRLALHHKTRFDWAITSGRAYQFLRLIRPYMRIKGGQADLVIEYYERLREHQGRHRGPVSGEERAWRDGIVNQISKLNARGLPRAEHG